MPRIHDELVWSLCQVNGLKEVTLQEGCYHHSAPSLSVKIVYRKKKIIKSTSLYFHFFMRFLVDGRVKILDLGK